MRRPYLRYQTELGQTKGRTSHPKVDSDHEVGPRRAARVIHAVHECDGLQEKGRARKAERMDHRARTGTEIYNNHYLNAQG